MKTFVIYDTTSETYESPITVRTTAEMERSLQILADRDPEHRFIKYSNDHALYEIGDFDPQSGELTLYPQKKHISNLSKYPPTQRPKMEELNQTINKLSKKVPSKRLKSKKSKR